MAPMQIHALTGRRPGERRSPITPESVRTLVEAGHQVTFEPGIGVAASMTDAVLEEAGARADSDPRTDLVVTVEPPDEDRASGAAAVLGLLEPLDNPGHLNKLATSGATLLAFELIPRTTRAQAVDVLSSQATLAGYHAALEGAYRCDRILPMLTTAAGTLRPAQVLVLGAGVAGLQAIATARRLGARVAAFDVRAAAAEQVESLGARFIELDLEPQDATATGGYAHELEDSAETRLLEGLHPHVVEADIVITAAAIPGRPAPRLVTAKMVEGMRPGSVVVDGSAATGGNCDLSRPGEVVDVDGVRVSAPLDLASRSAFHASQLFARNVSNFVAMITGDGAALDLDRDDEVVTGATVAKGGEIVHERVIQAVEGED